MRIKEVSTTLAEIPSLLGLAREMKPRPLSTRDCFAARVESTADKHPEHRHQERKGMQQARRVAVDEPEPEDEADGGHQHALIEQGKRDPNMTTLEAIANAINAVGYENPTIKSTSVSGAAGSFFQTGRFSFDKLLSTSLKNSCAVLNLKFGNAAFGDFCQRKAASSI